MRVKTDVLHYTERTQGQFRDLRQVELTTGSIYRGRFLRLSLNGQYRSGKRQYDATRYANPGWSFGTQRVLLNWTHFRRHCWHLSLEMFSRGLTLSYGRRIV